MEKEKLKIYHVLTDRNIGGAGRWLLNYLKYCNREKYDVRVVLPADSQLCPVVENLDIPVIKMDAMADSSYDKKALAPLTELFRKDKPDVVHTHASLTARMAAKKAGVPRIFHTKHCMENVSGNTFYINQCNARVQLDYKQNKSTILELSLVAVYPFAGRAEML